MLVCQYLCQLTDVLKSDTLDFSEILHEIKESWGSQKLVKPDFSEKSSYLEKMKQKFLEGRNFLAFAKNWIH